MQSFFERIKKKPVYSSKIYPNNKNRNNIIQNINNNFNLEEQQFGTINNSNINITYLQELNDILKISYQPENLTKSDIYKISKYINLLLKTYYGNNIETIKKRLKDLINNLKIIYNLRVNIINEIIKINKIIKNEFIKQGKNQLSLLNSLVNNLNKFKIEINKKQNELNKININLSNILHKIYVQAKKLIE